MDLLFTDTEMEDDTMMRRQNWFLSVAAIAVAALAASTAQAQNYYVGLAADNATVQPAGPRPGANGKRFFNVEGRDNMAFASYGVVEYNVADFGLPGQVTDTTFIMMLFQQSNAAFTTDGVVRFYITENTATSIQPPTPPDPPAVTFDNTDQTGLGTQLQPRHEIVDLISGGQFIEQKGEAYDVYFFILDGAAKTYFINQLNTGSKVRFVVAPGDEAVAATWAGATNETALPPLIIFDAVTQP